MSTPITSYGTITIVDLTDVGQYSVYPYANSSNTQIYSQETLQYSPDWAAQNDQEEYISPLVITPVITYAGEDKTTESAVTWYIKGNDTPIKTIPAGVADKTLTITYNLTNINYITYIVEATYTSNTGANVSAKGEISFNKLIQTSSSKGVTISGTNIFKYQTGSTTPTETSIILTPTPQGEVGFPSTAWEYWNSTNSTWNSVSGVSGLSENSSTHSLTVQHTSAAFNGGDIAKFKVTVRAIYNNETRSDEFSITKLRDGAAGGSLIQMDLSNDDQMVPLNSSGIAQWASIGNLAGTQVAVFEGNINKTANLGTGNNIKVYLTNVNAKTIKYFGTNQQTDSGGATLTPTNTIDGYTMDLANGYDAILVTAYTQDQDNNYYTSGSIRFVLTYNGISYSKVFSLIGIPAGEDGATPTIYTLEFDNAIKRINSAAPGASSDIWSYYPTNLVVRARSSDNLSTIYPGAIWYKTKGASTWTKATSPDNGEATINVANNLTIDKSPILFRLTVANAANCDNYLDQESIIVTSDGSVGAQGAEGNDGVSALNVVLTNENQSIKVTPNYTTIGQIITTSYQGYVGTTEASFTFVGATLDQNVPSGLFSPAPSANNGVITITVANGIDVSSYRDGAITLGFTYTDTDNSTTTLYKKFTFDMNPRGENAVTLQLEPSGSTFFKNGGPSNVIITPRLISGTEISSNNYTVVWKNAITNTTLGTNTTLTVTGDMVQGTLSVLCIVTYNSQEYRQYISFTDYDDPLKTELLCTLGEKIINSVGEGVIYALTTQSGTATALDYVMPGVTVDNTLVGHTESQLLLLTKSNGKVTNITLKNKLGTDAGSYNDAEKSSLTYSWSFRDIEGNPLTLSELKTLGMYISSGRTGADNGQFVYINANVVNKKLVCFVTVTKG